MSGIKQEMQWIQKEAGRCLYCVDAPCIKGCPVSVNVPQFVRSLRYGDVKSAAKIIKDSNPFGGVCGDLCPSEELCQKNCTLNCSGSPMKIRELQKYVCANAAYTPELPEANGKKVAIIGAGPSGLACAAMLSRKGYCVEVFDKEKEASGIIAKEIPNYRIDPAIVKKDLDELFCDRITVHHNVEVSMSEIQNDFSKKYDAVYVGVGLARDRNTGITVEGSSENVYACSKFLTEIKDGTLSNIKGSVCVIGGGNSAMDAARTALVCGAEKSMLAYRRSRFEMPACDEELLDTAARGVELMYMVSPTTIKNIGDTLEVTFVRNRLEELAGETRKSFKAIPNSEFTMKFDTVVIAAGKTIGDISFDSKPDEETLRIGTTNCFVGGDLINGGGTVVAAVCDGKKAAAAIDTFLMN